MEIIFKSIKARNFRSFPEFELKLDSPGITLVTGHVRGGAATVESNGAGKSSLFAAISWALFGKFSHVGGSSVTGNQVARRTAKSGCCVELELMCNEKHVTVKRYRADKVYGNKVLLFIDGVDVTTTSNSRTQELIEHTIGISYDIFINLVFISESSMRSSFALETDAVRKKFLITAFPDLQRFGDAREKVKQWQSNCTSFLQRCLQERRALIGTIEELERALMAYPRVDSQIIDLNEKSTDVRDKIALLSDQIPPEFLQPAKLETLRHQYVEVKANLLKYSNDLEKWSHYPQECPECGQPIPSELVARRLEECEFYKNRLTATMSELESLLTKLRHFQNLKMELDSLQKQLRQLQEVQESCHSQINALNARKKELSAQIEELRELERITESQLRSLDIIADGLGPRGALSLALLNVISVLTQNAEKWLKRLWHAGASVTFRLDDELSKIEAFLYVNGEEVDITSLSSGETRRTCLAICFALRETLQTLVNWQSNLLILDECFDGLDGVGRERVLEHLKSLTNTATFVISQFPTLDSSHISNHLVVVSERGRSSLT